MKIEKKKPCGASFFIKMIFLLAILEKIVYTIGVIPAGVMELVDVVDSKCASSFLAGLEKVVDIQALFKYNQIHKFNIPPAHPS